MDKKELGRFGENVVAFYLEKKGYKIICRNFVIRGGEIDIVASKGDIIAFIEVKTRAADYMTSGFDSVNMKKKKLIIHASEMYSIKFPHDLQPRFDVVQIIADNKKVLGFNYIENAFDASDIKTIL